MLSVVNKRVAFVGTTFILLCVAATASATPIVVGTTSNSGFTVSSTDLINGNPGVVTGASDEEGLGSNTTGTALTNGAFGPPGLVGPPNSDVVILHNGATATYTFASPVTITEIDTYAGWRDPGRADQNYTVFINGSSTPLVTVGYVSTGGNPTDTRVVVTDSTGTLATNVTSIEFSFPTTQNTYVGYRELDVFGTAVPEPGTFVLLGLGAVGLFRIRRRRK